MKRLFKGILPWILIILIVVLAYQLISYTRPGRVKIDYSRFLAELNDGNVSTVVIQENSIKGTLSHTARLENSQEFTEFETTAPLIDTKLVDALDEKGVQIEAKSGGGFWSTLLFTIGPWLLILLVFWFFIFRQIQAPGNKALSFGKSRARLLTENRPQVTFADVAGCEEAKEELREIIDFLKDPRKFQRLGGRIPKGVLIVGAPGTGKTLLAKVVAGEADVPFLSISGSDFVEMFVGVGAARVRDLFEQGRKNAPCIIFIDEIDAVGRTRGAGLGGGHDEREQTLNQLLVEMDGFDTKEGVILIAATNRPDVLDTALLRPGRFDRQIVVDRPDVRGREGILKVHTKNIPLTEEVDLSVLARETPYFTGADLANLVNEAALLAARRNKKKVDMDDMEEARDKVLMGPERKSRILSDTEKRLAAYHEVGHALMGKFIPGMDPVHKVTIIPRGLALGQTQYLPVDEKHTYSKSYLSNLLVSLLGGRVAEEVILNEVSSGAGNDLEKATEIARKMICEWGMSEKLGPATFGKKEEAIFLGREIAQHRDYSEETARLIDAEVKVLIEEAHAKAHRLLAEHKDDLIKLSKILLERETLTGDEMDLVLQGKEDELPPLLKAKKEDEPKPKKRTRKVRKEIVSRASNAEPEISPAG